jgi:hypothetical protein
MQMRMKAILRIVFAGAMAVTVMGAQHGAMAQAGDAVLTRADTQKLLPEKVYYKGQSATVQVRNSGGVKFADGYYVLATLVDTSGYSSDIQAKYSAYLIAEVPVKFGGKTLPAGAYGVGFVGNQFLVTDLGAHDVLSVPSGQDAEMKRPTPLQVLADSGGGYRLYEGRQFVKFSR